MYAKILAFTSLDASPNELLSHSAQIQMFPLFDAKLLFIIWTRLCTFTCSPICM